MLSIYVWIYTITIYNMSWQKRDEPLNSSIWELLIHIHEIGDWIRAQYLPIHNIHIIKYSKWNLDTNKRTRHSITER